MTRETREDQRRKDRSIVGARAGDEGNETGYAKGTASTRSPPPGPGRTLYCVHQSSLRHREKKSLNFHPAVPHM